MSQNRRIAKNSGILYLKLLITSVVGIIFARQILDVLGASDWGLYSVVAGFVAMLNISNLFLIGTTYRFISYELGKEDIRGINRVFNVSLSLHLSIAAILLLLSETVGKYYILNYLNVADGRLADAIFIFRISIMAAVFSIASVPYQGVMTAYEEFGRKSIIEVTQIVLKLVFAFSLIWYDGNRLRLYSVLMLVLIASCSVSYFLYCSKRHPSVVRWKPTWDFGKYREMLGFAGWSSIGSLVCVGRVQGNALIINYFFGTVLNASFGIANQVNQILLMFSQGIGQAAVPQIIQSYSSGNHKRATKLVCYTNKYSFLLMLLPSLPLLLEMDYLLGVWLVEVPVYTVIFCRLMIINALFDCLASSGIPAYVQATGKIKLYQLINGSTQLLVLPISFIALKLGSLAYAVLWVQIFITLFVIPVRLVLLKILYNFDIKMLFRVSALRGASVLILVLPLFAMKLLDQGFMRLILISLTTVVYYGFTVYFVGLESMEKAIVKDKTIKIFSACYARLSNAKQQ